MYIRMREFIYIVFLTSFCLLIMEQNELRRLVFAALFLVFAGVSCWATAESLRLLLPAWPVIFVWIITVGIFVLASLGSKLIVDSFNKYIYLEHRGWRLIGGILIMLAAWLLVSFPTNTHTFFYRSTIADVAGHDLATTRGYLLQLRDNVKTTDDINRKIDQLDREVQTQLVALDNEIDNLANPGFGRRAKAILSRLATILQVKEIPELSYKNASPKQINALKQQYRKLVYEQLDVRKSRLRETFSSAQEQHFKPEAEQAIRNMDVMQEHLGAMAAAGDVDNDMIRQTDVALKGGYAVIHNYAQFVNFNSPEDQELYTAPEQITRTSRMLSVFDVWRDFIAGHYAGRGFIFWILLSLVIDIAAFIFFDIAFKASED